MHIKEHFQTITYHRRLVRQSCFRVGLYWQGLTHDLSKYSLTEFLVGAKYFQGDCSPNKRGKQRAIQSPGCIIRAEISTILNIGLIIPCPAVKARF